MKKEETAFFVDLKAIMEHAILHQQNGSKLDMRFGVNHAHQAVELTLRKKAELLGKNPLDFPKLVKQLKKEGISIPNERQIDELNKARVLIQHYGTTPNDNDARRLIFAARDFLIAFWKEAFEINYEDISLIDLINNEEIKELLREAEKADNYKQRLIKSLRAIYEVKWWIESRFHEARLTWSLVSLDVEDALDFVLDIALSSPFASKLWKLRKSTGIVFLPIPGGEPVMQQLKKYRFTRKDAAYALELATEYALWAEQVYG